MKKKVLQLLLAISIVLNTFLFMDKLFSTEYVNVEIHYADDKGDFSHVYGVMNKRYVKDIDRPHTKVYVYGIEDVNTDDITSVVIK